MVHLPPTSCADLMQDFPEIPQSRNRSVGSQECRRRPCDQQRERMPSICANQEPAQSRAVASRVCESATAAAKGNRESCARVSNRRGRGESRTESGLKTFVSSCRNGDSAGPRFSHHPRGKSGSSRPPPHGLRSVEPPQKRCILRWRSLPLHPFECRLQTRAPCDSSQYEFPLRATRPRPAVQLIALSLTSGNEYYV